MDLIMFHDKIRTTDLEGVYERVTFENTGISVDCIFVGFFCLCFFFPKGKNFYVRDECLCALVPCVVPSCVLEAGVLRIHTSFQKQLRSLFSIPIFVRIASGIHIVVWVSGVPRNVASAAVLGMMLSFWLGVLLCPSPVPAVLHCFLPMPKAPVSCFLFYTLVF